MPVVFGGVTPHPPLLVPAVGKDALSEVRASQEGMRLFSIRLAAASPDLLLLVTPHGPVFREAPSIFTTKSFSGDFRHFGAPEVRLEAENDIPVARRILDATRAAGLPLIELDELSLQRHRIRPLLDHATMVPLYYFQEAGVRLPMVLISIGMTSYEELFRFGKVILRCVLDDPRRIALVASGDLSHRLIPGAPAGYDPVGKEFDRLVLDLLKNGNFRGILSVDGQLIERAGECGFRPITILSGAWEELAPTTSVVSYEGPFGVGYGVVLCEMGAVAREPAPQLEEERWILDLARRAAETFVKEGQVISPPGDIPPRFARQGAVFVSLHRNGRLRGCIGTLDPVTASAAIEVIEMAVGAATRDSRFPPVSPGELPHLSYSVDLLSPLDRVAGPEDLDPRRYGVVVQHGERRGVLLPDLTGVETVEAQLGIACEKAGIPAGSPLDLFRFTVIRYGEKG